MRFSACGAGLISIFLVACGHPPRPPVTIVLDEDVELVRGANVDLAQREFDIPDNSIVIAFVDEQLTDVRLEIGRTGSKDEHSAVVEVENNLEGAGFEIAALRVADSSRITFTLTGPQDLKLPGKVHLRVNIYPIEGAKHGDEALRIRAFEEW